MKTRSLLASALSLFCFAPSWFLLAGCKPSPPQITGQDQTQRERPAPSASPDAKRKPDAESLARFLRGRLPAEVKLVDLKADPPVPAPDAAPSSNAWLYNVRLVLAPAEDLLGAPAPQVATAFQSPVDELNALAAWSQAYARSSYAARYPALPVESPDPAQPKLLAVIHAKDQPLPAVYGKIEAEWQVDRWHYAVTSLQTPDDDHSKPRSEYPGSVLVQGRPEAEQFLAKVKANVTVAKPKQAAIEAAYRADVLKATQPGATFRGQLRNHGKAVPVEVLLTAPPAGSDPQQEVQLEVRLPDTPGESFVYLARRAKRLPLRPVIPAAPADTDPLRPVAPVEAPALTVEGEEPLPKGDLTLSLVTANGKLGKLDGSVPSEFLLITRQQTQPSSVTLSVHDGRLEGRLNGYSTDTAGFALSAQQNP